MSEAEVIQGLLSVTIEVLLPTAMSKVIFG